MLKVPHARKYHGYSQFVRHGDHLFIPDGSARLDYRLDACPCGLFYAIFFREERVAGERRAFCAGAGLLGGDLYRIDSFSCEAGAPMGGGSLVYN